MWRDVQRVITQKSAPARFRWGAVIHSPSKFEVEVLKVVSIDFVENYAADYAEGVMIDLIIGGGQVAHHIVPYRDQLELTLVRVPVTEIGLEVDNRYPITYETYRATLINTGDPAVTGGSNVAVDEFTLDITNVLTMKFQLINKAVEQIRMQSVGENGRYTDVENFLTTLITKTIRNIEVDGLLLPEGLDIVTPDNEAVRDHIVVPQGTPIMDVPDLLQQQVGVYSNGIAHFIKNRHWYVFSPYNFTRFQQTERRLDVIFVPENKLPGIERTWLEENGTITVLATGEKKVVDNSEAGQLNAGNGVRFSDADRFMNNFVQAAGNKAIASRGTIQTEVVAKERANGLNNVRMSSTRITANPYLEYSRLAKREGRYVQFLWENSNKDLIIPGMAIRITYVDGKDIREFYGVIHAAHSYIHLMGSGATATDYVTNTAISAFVTIESE